MSPNFAGLVPHPLAQAFVKECVRLDCPVTSATSVFEEPTEVTFDKSCCFGCRRTLTLRNGELTQYVLSIANRDPSKFSEPHTFNPRRANLDALLTWNGALDAPPGLVPAL